MKNQRGGTSALIINNKDQILLVKRADDDDFLPGSWELPGGGVEYGETAQEAIIREIKEECGIEIEVLKPVAVADYFINDTQILEICFLCDPKCLDIKLSHEHSDFKWLKIDAIRTLDTSDYTNRMIYSAVANLK